MRGRGIGDGMDGLDEEPRVRGCPKSRGSAPLFLNFSIRFDESCLGGDGPLFAGQRCRNRGARSVWADPAPFGHCGASKSGPKTDFGGDFLLGKNIKK